MDEQKYNGWPNKCTWQVYTVLSNEEGSQKELSDLVANIRAASEHDWKPRAAHAIEYLIEEYLNMWVEPLQSSGATTLYILFRSLLTDALHQVDWEHVAEGFADE